jgi:hypothetical protein
VNPERGDRRTIGLQFLDDVIGRVRHGPFTRFDDLTVLVYAARRYVRQRRRMRDIVQREFTFLFLCEFRLELDRKDTTVKPVRLIVDLWKEICCENELCALFQLERRLPFFLYHYRIAGNYTFKDTDIFHILTRYFG